MVICQKCIKEHHWPYGHTYFVLFSSTYRKEYSMQCKLMKIKHFGCLSFICVLKMSVTATWEFMLYPELIFITNKYLKRTEVKVANVISTFINLIKVNWAVLYEHVNTIPAIPNILLYTCKIHFYKQSPPCTWLLLFWWALLLTSLSHTLIIEIRVSTKTPLSSTLWTIKQKTLLGIVFSRFFTAGILYL